MSAVRAHTMPVSMGQNVLNRLIRPASIAPTIPPSLPENDDLLTP